MTSRATTLWSLDDDGSGDGDEEKGMEGDEGWEEEEEEDCKSPLTCLLHSPSGNFRRYFGPSPQVLPEPLDPTQSLRAHLFYSNNSTLQISYTIRHVLSFANPNSALCSLADGLEMGNPLPSWL